MKEKDPYKILDKMPFIYPIKKAGVGEFVASKKYPVYTDWLQSCIALYFIYDSWLWIFHIYTGRTDGYNDVRWACEFVKRTNKRKKKVIYGIVEGITPYDDENEHRKSVFKGVEDIPIFLSDYEIERKKDLMSWYVIITKSRRIIIRNHANKLDESWDIDYLPDFSKDHTLTIIPLKN
jgi:hypothetical protein